MDLKRLFCLILYTLTLQLLSADRLSSLEDLKLSDSLDGGDISNSLDKRRWKSSPLTTWGKRWNPRNGWGSIRRMPMWVKKWTNSRFITWGKRSGVDNTDEKRKWNQFVTWGKRDWDDLPTWGKRGSDWKSFNTWGKRSKRDADPAMLPPEESMKEYPADETKELDKIPSEVKTNELSNSDNKRASNKWTGLTTWGKRANNKWTGLTTWGKRGENKNWNSLTTWGKRGKNDWSSLTTWGKRGKNDWSSLTTWGKRGGNNKWSGLTTWGKRNLAENSKKWADFTTWGKRAGKGWKGFTTWGKRGGKGWQGFTTWGKRSGNLNEAMKKWAQLSTWGKRGNNWQGFTTWGKRSPEESFDLWKKIDSNGDGTIDKEEMISFFDWLESMRDSKDSEEKS